MGMGGRGGNIYKVYRFSRDSGDKKKPIQVVSLDGLVFHGETGLGQLTLAAFAFDLPRNSSALTAGMTEMVLRICSAAFIQLAIASCQYSRAFLRSRASLSSEMRLAIERVSSAIAFD